MLVAMRFILASSSPRRSELLTNAGFQFEIRPAAIDENPWSGERPEDYARRLAREKALSVARSCGPGLLVLGADTVVAMDHDIFCKPTGPFDGTRILRALSGRTHRVITGVCLVRAPERLEAWTHETTFVTFRELDEDEIRAYVASGEPFDKAGGYAIQGLASRFVTHIEGCFFNVVGVPIPLVYEILKNVPVSSPSAP
jgi:nucleoside triphosphate pyrophosphatase